MELYKLNNQVKHYDWGSPDLIPQLMGCAADGRPWAELWMGSHPGSPSQVSLASGEVNLGELIARDPRRYLGNKTAERYGELPFLFKLLAAEKPLSIQAHPNLAQAREGFERENRAGLAPDAHNRSYRDSNHKPEIICALTPFTGMCGFRDPGQISQLLGLFLDGPSVPAILREGFAPLLRALQVPDTASALRGFLSALFGLPTEVRKALTKCILSTDFAAQNSPLPPDERTRTGERVIEQVQYGVGQVNAAVTIKSEGPPNYELMWNFAQLYPGDPAVIAPLYLNVFHLEPGEAIFLDAGLLHAYVHGFGVELMANSDNVLRGGLTAKHIDIPELMKVLEFCPHEPLIIKPESEISCFIYPAPCDEFSLAVMNGGKANAVIFTPSGPTICIVIEGELIVSDNEENVILKQGESAFIPPTAQLMMQGNYIMYAASVGINSPLG